MSTRDQDEYDKYFQADHTVATQQRRLAKSSNKRGDPTRNNKIAALVFDPADQSSSHVFAAEATGTVRRINIDDGSSKVVLSQPTAPLTCIAAVPAPDGEGSIVFAGCWDKCIYSATIEEGKSRSPQTFKNVHTDFIKAVAVHTIGTSTYLVSGSADRSIAIWDVATAKLLLQLKAHHTTSLTSVLIDPYAIASTPNILAFFSSSSDGEITQTMVNISAPNSLTLASKTSIPIAHPTSVYSLALIGDDGDLLTASADGTAAVLSRYRNWEEETRFTHGGHVRCASSSADGTVVVTGGRDEDVRVWDASEGTCVAVVDGHFDEVMAVVVVEGRRGVDGTAKGLWAVTGGLDGTVRKWDLAAEKEKELKKAADGDNAQEAEVEKKDAKKGQKTVELTAEEEAELRELMDSDDE